jgi:hypothetical protein
MTTGADATPADPIQVSLTSKQGGKYRIDRITAPTSRPTTKTGYGLLVFPNAPQTVITPPCGGEGVEGCQPYAVRFLIDSSVMPAAGNGLFGVIGKNRLNTLAEITGFCSRLPNSQAGGCSIDDPLQRRNGNPDQPRHTMLPNGDITVEYAPSGPEANPQETLVYDFGHVPSRLSSNVDREGDLSDLLANKYKHTIFCNLLCTTTVKLTVSSAIKSKFKLANTTIAKKTFTKPGYVQVTLSATTRRKLKKVKRLTVTATFSGKDVLGKSGTFKGSTVFTRAAQDG